MSRRGFQNAQIQKEKYRITSPLLNFSDFRRGVYSRGRLFEVIRYLNKRLEILAETKIEGLGYREFVIRPPKFSFIKVLNFGLDKYFVYIFV